MNRRLKTYRVATFYHDNIIGNVLCYLRDYNPNWDGCIIYEVEAFNGEQAKKIAKFKRQTYEKRLIENQKTQGIDP